jgi:hypothetical protein
MTRTAPDALRRIIEVRDNSRTGSDSWVMDLWAPGEDGQI